MKQTPSPRILAALLAVAAFGVAAPSVSAGVVDPALAARISGLKPGTEVPIILVLADRVPLTTSAPRGPERKDSLASLVRALKAKAAATQPALLGASAALGGRLPISLWALNAVALRIPHERIPALSRLPGVESVRLDAILDAPAPPQSAADLSFDTAVTVEWNVDLLRAPELWATGIDGTGAVVATLDTGVDPDHPDVGPRWRGGANSWYDPNGQHASPYDASGHGTQTMGLLLGGSAGGSAIGVAPGATWISAKIFNDQGQATVSGIHLAFQWLLDPDGNPETNDAPDVVSNSWNFPSTVGACWTEFATDLAVLRAAAIEVVFAAGNDGGAAGTSESPANNPGAFPVGAVDSSLAVAPFSGRGPSACDGGPYPGVVAGGVSVRSADLSFGGVVPNPYAFVTGTSFSAPQVAGIFALLASAYPSASLESLEEAIRSTATDLGIPGPDGDTGFGLPNALMAYRSLANLPAPPVAAPDSWTVTAGAPLAVPSPGVLGNDGSPTGAGLSAILLTGPSRAAAGSFSLAANGSFTYATNLLTATTDSFTYAASDGTLQSPAATVTIAIAAHPAPVARGDAYQVSRNSPATTFAVLANDAATNATLVPSSVKVVTRPNRDGTASVNSNGTISYKPRRNFRGTETFTYDVEDSLGATSNIATVHVTVK